MRKREAITISVCIFRPVSSTVANFPPTYGTPEEVLEMICEHDRLSRAFPPVLPPSVISEPHHSPRTSATLSELPALKDLTGDGRP